MLPNSPRRSFSNCSSACGSNAPSAITIRANGGASRYNGAGWSASSPAFGEAAAETGTEAINLSKAGTDHKHPRTGELVPAQALGAEPAKFENIPDRRSSGGMDDESDNPFFAMANCESALGALHGCGLAPTVRPRMVNGTGPAFRSARRGTIG